MARSDTPETTRRPRLDAEAVLSAAETIVDDRGYEALTMTLLAEHLNTRVSSLYNHVASLRDLQAHIQVRAMKLLCDEVCRAAMGRAGAEGLRVLSLSLRDFAKRYPERYSALTRPPLDKQGFLDASRDVLGALSVMIASTGLPEDKVLNNGMAVFSALHGFVSLEASGYFEGIESSLDEVYDQIVIGAVNAAVEVGTATTPA